MELLAESTSSNWFLSNEFTESVIVFQYFDLALANIPDILQTVDWNTSVVVAFIVKTITACCFSVLCIVLNSLLVCFLLTSKDFRNLNFTPAIIQAVVDIMGPGVANCCYEIMLYYNSRYNDFGVELSRFLVMESRVQAQSTIGCVFTFLRVILNEYTTGTCVVATAYIRYILVCHPTKNNFVSSKILWVWIIAILVVATSALATNLIVVFWDYVFPSSEVLLTTQIALQNCDLLYSRSSPRVLIDLLLCLVAPAPGSNFFGKTPLFFRYSGVNAANAVNLQAKRL